MSMIPRLLEHPRPWFGTDVLSETEEMVTFLRHWERKWQSQGWISGKGKIVPKVLLGLSESPLSLGQEDIRIQYLPKP